MIYPYTRFSARIRRGIHHLLCLCAAAAMLGLASNPAAQSTSPSASTSALRVAIVSRTVFYVPLWTAMQAGHFARAGLNVDVEVFDNAEKIADALRGGAVQVAISTPETVILDAVRGGNLRIVAGNAERLPHFVIAKPGIRTPADLKGAVFGVLSMNEGTTFLVHEYARSVGLQPGDYQVSAVGGAPTRWRLLREGKIDAGLQPFPLSYEAEAAGFTNLGSISKVVPEWQFTSVNVDQRWAEKNRRTLTQFLAGLVEGTRAMQSNPDLAAEIAARELKTTLALAKRALDDTQSLRILSKDLTVSEPGVKTVFQSLIQTNQLDKATPFDMRQLVDASYLPTHAK